MIHTYKISGMTCEKCVNTVLETLSKINGVEKANVTLSPPEAVITMNRHILTSDINKILKEDSDYNLEEINNGHHRSSDSISTLNDNKSFFSAYKPVLLLFSYIILAASLKEVYDGSFNPMRFMQVFMGGFFLTFSFFKMLDLKGFAYSYMTYDVIAKRWLGWGYVYAFIELLLGLAFLFGFKPIVTNIVTIIIMSISSIGVIQSLLNKRKIQCACLGTVFNLPMSNITLIEDLLMVLMAGISFVL